MKWILALSASGGFLLNTLVLGGIPDLVTVIEANAAALPIIFASALVVEKLTGDSLP